MVERVDGKGRHIREIVQDFGIENNASFRRVVFDMQDDVAKDTLDRVIDDLKYNPEVDNRSTLVFNATGNRGDVVSLLIGPSWGITSPFEVPDDVPGLPPVDQSFIVAIDNHKLRKSKLIPVVVDNSESASRIASRLVRSQGWMRLDMNVAAYPVSPDELVARSAELLYEGERLTRDVLCYAGLRGIEKKIKNAS